MESKREKVIRLVQQMRSNQVGNGCTPAEAAAFAAKAAELIERFQIEEAELAAKGGSEQPEIEVAQNKLRTGKRVFNPGMTDVVHALAQGMSCKLILLKEWYDGQPEAVYGIVGDRLDADYVCTIATSVVPALQTTADLEAAEHGYEKAGLVRWRNQFLRGAAQEIQARLEKERRDRAVIKQAEHLLLKRSEEAELPSQRSSTAIACITGETIAAQKREAVAVAFTQAYPKTRTARASSSAYDPSAYERGREAGKTVGLNIALEGKE